MAALKASVVIENQHVVERLLRDLGVKLERKIIRSAMRKGMKPMLDATKKNAPVDTGLMRKSLVVRALKNKPGRIALRIGFKNVDAIVQKSSKDPKKKRWFYPAVVEYGGKNRTAHPFMRPAFDSNKQQSIDTINKEVRLGIEQWAARNANK